MMRIKFFKRPSPIPPKFYYRSGEVTKVMKITPKTWKSADQQNNLIPDKLHVLITSNSEKKPGAIVVYKDTYHISDIWVVHGGPCCRIPSYRPGKQHNIIRLEPKFVYCILHDWINSILYLVWEWHTLKGSYRWPCQFFRINGTNGKFIINKFVNQFYQLIGLYHNK